MVHCVAARRGMRLRKSNSAPSLLILAESTEDNCDAISVCFADEVQGPEGRGCSKMVADSAMHSETVPLYFSSLRHVDSMELMARDLVDHINQVFPDSIFLRQISRFSAHSIHSRVLLQSAGEGGRKDVCLPNRNRSCALPHVDSCELIAPLLGHYEADDTHVNAGSVFEFAASANASLFHRIAQLPSSRQNGPGSDPFEDALSGIRHGHGTDRSFQHSFCGSC